MPGLGGPDGEHPLMINESSGAKLPILHLTSAGQSEGGKLDVWPTSAEKSNSSQPSVVDTAHARDETPSNAALSPSVLRAVQQKASVKRAGSRDFAVAKSL